MNRLHQAAPFLLKAARTFLDVAGNATPEDMDRLTLMFSQAVSRVGPLTVGDMVRELSRMPQDAPVSIWADGSRLWVDSIEWFDQENFVEITAGVDE
jgi:hypothetical protein